MERFHPFITLARLVPDAMSRNEYAADEAQNATDSAPGLADDPQELADGSADAAGGTPEVTEGAQNTSEQAATLGPSTELPDVVPEFVGDIHATVSDFTAGEVENLGEAIRDIAADAAVAEVAAVAVDIATTAPV